MTTTAFYLCTAVVNYVFKVGCIYKGNLTTLTNKFHLFSFFDLPA